MTLRTSVFIARTAWAWGIASTAWAQPAPHVAPPFTTTFAPPAEPARTSQTRQAPEAVTDLDFAQMLLTPVARHGLAPSPLLLALSGHAVRVRGYRVVQDAPPAGWFWLTPQAMRMSEHADGEANDLPPNALRVVLGEGAVDRLPQQTGARLELVGTLHWGRQELPDGSVSWLRLQLDCPTQALDGAC